MIYLIGVEHQVQSISVGGDESADHTKYRLALEGAITKYVPTVVAEEYSQDALDRMEFFRKTPQEFFTKKVANNVRHLPCDPDIRTKYAMGYQGAPNWEMRIPSLRMGDSRSDRPLLAGALEVLKDFPIREKYWLMQMKDVLQQEVVFVCGDGHLDTFGHRLKDNGIPSQVVERQIGMPPELIEKSAKITAYIEHNSQFVEDVFQKLRDFYGGRIPPYEVN